MSGADLDPVPLCAALADETRWQVLELLGERELSASELADLLPVSRQAVAKHLQVLSSVGLVTSSRDGRSVRHVAVGAPLSRLASRLETVGRAWETRLARLADLAEQLDGGARS